MISNQHSKSLSNRVVTASSWVIGGVAGGHIIRLASNLIMTRLLVPEMFGVMALANVLIVGIALFSDIGIRQNIIQSNRGDDPIFLNTAWTLQIIRGALIYLIALSFVLPLYYLNKSGRMPLDSVYAEPILPYVIAVLSFSSFINGFESTKLATMSRDLSQGYIIRIELLSQVAGLVFKISWAFIDRSVWALVGGALFVSFLKVIFTHTLLPGEKNRFYWDIDAFKEIFHFGKWVFLNSILFFMVQNGDRLLLSGLVNPFTLGLYAIALFIVNSIQLVIQRVAYNVAFPAFSEVFRDNPNNLKNTYYKFRFPIDAITLFSVGFLYITGELLIGLLYDPRYLDAGYMLRTLSVTLFMERYILVGACFLSKGKPNLLLPFVSIRLISLLILVPLFNKLFGFGGLLWAIVLHRFTILPVFIFLKVKNKLFDLKRELFVLPFIVLGFLGGFIFNKVILFFIN